MGKYKRDLVYAFLYNMPLEFALYYYKNLSRRRVKVIHKRVRLLTIACRDQYYTKEGIRDFLSIETTRKETTCH